MDARECIARRVARELRDGFYVNLGIGIPTLVSNFVPAGIEVVLAIGKRHARRRPLSARRPRPIPISSTPARKP